MRARRLCVRAGLAVVLAMTAGPLLAAEPLPEDTVPSTGAPPLVPDGGKETQLAWVEACIASGRRQAGTRAGGDLLYSAGVVLAGALGQDDRALDVLGEASTAYPTDAPYRGLVLLEAAELQLARGDAVAALGLLDAVEDCARQPIPLDADVVVLSRHTLLQERAAAQGTALAVRIEEARGDLAAAADRQEAAALRRDRAGEPRAVRAWARTARLHARAGRKERASAAVDRALELADNDALRADLSFWRLHLRYGLLDTEGAPSLGTHWPGDAFVAETHATMRGLQGNPHVGTWLLTIGSRAVTAGQDETALDLYLLALRDPVLLDRARDDPDLWGGLLVAFPVALRLGRIDEAERILDVIARVADVPTEDLDGYRLALARAQEREMAADMPAPEVEDVADAEEAESTPSSPHRGRLYPHGPPEDAFEETGSSESPEPEGEAAPSADSTWLLAGVFAVLGLILFPRWVRRARRT